MLGRAKGRWVRGAAFGAGVALLATLGSGGSVQGADCQLARGVEGPQTPFVRQLGVNCSDRDREAQAVPAADIMAALRDGRDVELDGVAVSGDLFLDGLPELPMERLPAVPEALREVLSSRSVKTVKHLAGKFRLTHAVMHGIISTHLQTGALVVRQPVNFSGTRFERAVDWSQAAFVGAVDFSDAVFFAEAYFVNSVFAEAATFERTAFGVHSRFHHAQFHGPVTFNRAGFNGLSEFLEVTFTRDAQLSRTYFKLGTGFSGSRFGGVLDFSEAVFDKDAFFTYTIFERDAYFRRSTFRATADFSDAEFRQLGDFSKVLFEQTPTLTRTKLATPPRGSGGLEDPRTLYVIAALLGVFTLVLVLFLRKG